LFKSALNNSFSKVINTASFSNKKNIKKKKSTIDSDLRKRFGFESVFQNSKIVVKLCCVVTSVDHRISSSINTGAFYPV